MALVTISGSPLTFVGVPTRIGALSLANASSFPIDLANESLSMIGHLVIFDASGAPSTTPRTIDTTGSSSLGWRAMAVTFNSGTVVKIGLASVDPAAGPPARPVNSTGVITFSVSRSVSTVGGITANAWNEHVPDAGSATLSTGDIIAFSVQMTARTGTDVVNVGTIAEGVANTVFPAVTAYTPSTWSRNSGMPNAVITFRDGARGYIYGGYVQNGNTTATTVSTVAAVKEVGNLFQFHSPCRVSGFVVQVPVTGNMDVKLYTDPFGTPSLQRSVSLLATQVSFATSGPMFGIFPTPFDLNAGEAFVVAVQPTTSTSMSAAAATFNHVNHQEAVPGYGYAVTRNSLSAPFSAQNTQRDRYLIGPTMSGIHHPAMPVYALGI